MLKMIIFSADFCWCWLEQFGLDIKAVLYMPGKCVYKQIRKKIQLDSFPRYPLPPHQKAVHHVVHRKVIAARVSGPI